MTTADSCARALSPAAAIALARVLATGIQASAEHGVGDGPGVVGVVVAAGSARDNGDIYSLAWNISDLVINLGFAHIMYEVLFTPKPVDDKKAVDQTPPQSPPAAKAAATKSKTATKRKSQ